jgi:hypothetical protein
MQRTSEIEFECPFSPEDCEGVLIEIECTDAGASPSGIGGPPEFSDPGYGPSFEYEVPTKCVCGNLFERETFEKMQKACEKKTESWDFSPDDDSDDAYDRWVDERDSNFGG